MVKGATVSLPDIDYSAGYFDTEEFDLDHLIEMYPQYEYIIKLGDQGLIDDITTWYGEYNDTNNEYWTQEGGTQKLLDELNGVIQKSTWYTTHVPEERQALIEKVTDPAAYQERIEDQRERIRDTAVGLGISLTDQELAEYSEDAVLGNWQTEEVEMELAKIKYDPTSKPSTGSINRLAKQLQGLANKQLIGDNAIDAWKWAWDITTGKNTIDNALQRINTVAANDWGVDDFDIGEAYATDGTTLSDRLDGVKRTLGQYWDLGDNEIDLMDIGADNLVITGDDVKKRFMTMKEAKFYARQDDRFLNSDIYKKEIGAVGVGLNRMMQ